MAKKKLLMISLKEDEAKKVAQVISNETCRKMLDYLADKEATESELAEKLGIPISTAHYNLKQLMKSGLVIAEEYHYSKRGKEVNHYKLANQYIIIAPKKVSGIKEKLKSILPVGIITLCGAGIIHLYQKFSFATSSAFSKVTQAPAAFAQKEAVDVAKVAADEVMAPTVTNVMTESAAVAGNVAVNETTRNITNAVPEAIQAIPPEPNYALWFLIGGLTVLVLLLLIEIIRAIRSKEE